MSDKAGDQSRRTTAEKERSRQLSRPVSGKDAARGAGGSSRSQSNQRGAAARRAAQSAAARGTQGSGRGGSGRGGSGRGGSGRGGSGRGGSGRAAGRGRRPAARPGRSRTALFTWAAVAVVVIVVVVVVVISQTGTKTPGSVHYTPTPVPASILHEITHVPASVYDKVGIGIAVTPPRVETGQPALTYKGKPGEFSLLGEFCPFCAAERWALITSLSRFGTFSGLQTMQSSPVDVYPKTQTYTFRTATYTSPYLSANLLEAYGQDKATGKHPTINPPTKSDLALISKYDTGSATSSGGTIPFSDFGNKVIFSGASYSPGPLQGLSRATIAASLANPNSSVTKLIIGTSNYMSAAICSIDGGKPGSVCKSAGVQAAAKALKLSS